MYRTDKIIDSVGEMAVFIILDNNNSYRQVKVEKTDCDKTAFTS